MLDSRRLNCAAAQPYCYAVPNDACFGCVDSSVETGSHASTTMASPREQGRRWLWSTIADVVAGG